VLINGKRLHQSSLLNVNNSIGRGTSSVDLNTIPIASIERVEVLRDGAAAQYGSDAIAGVINVILKGYGHDNEATVSYGKRKLNDGETKQPDIFYSIPLKYDGFFNITGEFRDKAQTNRAGADSRDQYPGGDPRNDLPDPVNMHYGDTDTKDMLLMLNREVVTKMGMTLYMHGLYNDRDSEAAAFVRRPVDPRNNTNIYPDGFLPIIAPEIKDYSFSVGAKDILKNSVKWDLSYTHGFNDYHFFVNDSLNHSLGDASQTSFDSGGTSYRQEVANLNISKKFDSLFLAAGVEYRKENYRIYAGEEASYSMGGSSTIAGAQGFPGFQPSNVVDANRNNFGAYVDANYELNKKLTFGLASRYENYSDFGSNIDGKLSVTYKPVESVLFRSNVSSGFRAPSLTQSYYTSTTTAKIGVDFYEAGTFAVNHDVARALGAVDLKPEKSKHLSAGIVYSPNSNFSFSADVFYTAIDDRIMLSSNIKGSVSADVQTILDAHNVSVARFFTNAISTETTGVDLRLKYRHKFKNSSILKSILSYHADKTIITGVNTAPSILGTNGEDIIVDDLTRRTIESGQPQDNIQLYNQLKYHDFTYLLNINRYGGYESVWGSTAFDFKKKWVVDMEASYSFKKRFTIAFGAENIFDMYPDKWGDTGSAFGDENGIIPYSQYSPFGYNGAFYYTRLSVKF